MSEQGNPPEGPHGNPPQPQGWGDPAGQTPPPPPPPGAGHPGPAYAPPPPGYGYPGAPDPGAPFGRHPLTGEPYGDKSKLLAGLLQLLVGTLGIGRFYTGHTGIAIAQLLTCGGCGIWALVDGVMLLIQDDQRDANGRLLRAN